MKVSTMTNLCYSSRGTDVKTPALEASRRLFEAGFENQDLFLCGLARPVQKCSFSGDNWKDEVLELKTLADDLGINFHQCHLPYYTSKIYDDNNEEFNAFFWNMFDRGIEICKMLGITTAVVHPFSAEADRDDLQAHVAENRRLYGSYAMKAAQSGIRFAFENLSRSIHFSSRAEDLLPLIEEFRPENAGICWDIGHGQMNYGDEQAKVIEMLGDKIIALHVHDNFGAADNHLPPFLGTIKWEAIMGALKRGGYQGYLNYEVASNRNVPDKLRDETARYCAEAGKVLVQMFEEENL